MPLACEGFIKNRGGIRRTWEEISSQNPREISMSSGSVSIAAKTEDTLGKLAKRTHSQNQITKEKESNYSVGVCKEDKRQTMLLISIKTI